MAMASRTAGAVAALALRTGAAGTKRAFSPRVDSGAVAAAGEAVPDLIARGEALFEAKFAEEEGAGRSQALRFAITPPKIVSVTCRFARSNAASLISPCSSVAISCAALAYCCVVAQIM